MSDEMTHDMAREALEALALDALDAAERDAVMAHVAGCAICQSELAALENVTGELALAANPLALHPAQRDRIRARLLARATVDARMGGLTPTRAVDVAAGAPVLRVEPGAAPHSPRHEGVVPITVARRPRTNAAAWFAMAASVIAVLGVAGFLNARRERDELRGALQTAAADGRASKAQLDSLHALLDDKTRMIANLTGPDVAVMSLAAAGPKSPTGRMFWDQAHGAWTFVAHNVPMPKNGRTYQMWLVTPTAKISAGTFMPSPGGEVMMQATYQMPKDSLAAVAVTDEPMGGSPQPTTQPMMVASK